MRLREYSRPQVLATEGAWREGFPALIVTDTAPLRNPHYHTRGDTPDTLDYERLSRAVDGLKAAIADLVGVE